MPAKKAATKRSMSAEHKAAMADGREAGRAVRAYLDGLEAAKPRRGRKRTAESIQRRLDVLTDSIPVTEPLKRVALIQERMDLEQELVDQDDAVDLSRLEAGFIKHAASYSDRKGISYAAWRELGVAPATLKAAGIRRS